MIAPFGNGNNLQLLGRNYEPQKPAFFLLTHSLSLLRKLPTQILLGRFSHATLNRHFFLLTSFMSHNRANASLQSLYCAISHYQMVTPPSPWSTLTVISFLSLLVSDVQHHCSQSGEGSGKEGGRRKEWKLACPRTKISRSSTNPHWALVVNPTPSRRVLLACIPPVWNILG